MENQRRTLLTFDLQGCFMDANDAKNLLGEIKKAESEGWGLGSLLGSATTGIKGAYNSLTQSKPVVDPAKLHSQIQQTHNTKLQEDATKTILKTMLLAGGLGAAVRGYSGLTNLPESKKRKKPQRTIEMPVAYPEKQALFGNDNSKATSMIGLDYFAPAMLLGAPLAAYGGWKGVDAIMNKQREKEVDSDLERAKAEYEKALLGSYKKGTDEALDVAFDLYKQANPEESKSMLTWLADKISPNLTGAGLGLGLAYTAATAPLGYHLVNKAMQRNSKQALLRKAMEERARRQAKIQPPEIYAVPTPVEPEQE